MRRSEFRVACASVGVFIWLGGLYFTIRGLVYEVPLQFRYGILAIIIGVATFVIALSRLASRNATKRSRSAR